MQHATLVALNRAVKAVCVGGGSRGQTRAHFWREVNARMAGQLEPGMSLKELADAWAAHRGKTLADLHEAVGSVMDVRAAPAMTSKRAARLRLVCSRDGCGERLDADMTGLRCLSCTISDYARREVSGLPRLLGLCRKKGDMTAYKKCEADVRAFFDKPHTGKMPRL